MFAKFTAKKSQILERLSKPLQDYTDSSPKGSVDEGIRVLVEEINSTPGFVTTSSCAGRVAVFLEGAPEPRIATGALNQYAEESSFQTGSSVPTSAGGKGGGKWLFTSHSSLDLGSLSNPGALFKRLGFSSDSQITYPSLETRPQFIHFKFEPMVRTVVFLLPLWIQCDFLSLQLQWHCPPEMLKTV